MSTSSNASIRSSSSGLIVKLKTTLKNFFGFSSRKSKRDAEQVATAGVVEIPGMHMGQTGEIHGTHMEQNTEPQWPLAQAPAPYTNPWPDQMAQAGSWAPQYNNAVVNPYHNHQAAVAHPSYDAFNNPDYSAFTMTQTTYATTQQSTEVGYIHNNYTDGTAQMGNNQINWRRNYSVSVAAGNNINFGGRILQT
ncbi:hypothetical protein P691DRAFT_774779 [Macrolepiota fuliginosa MF-IS2]|uniref:Uncharacterized protein n=1 Tax=Macrolepiota fuliginosa MF-IS2 TaxID=1400762 RepID=A0A9P5XGT7_9AGAR|nr:hypothetical protein P691DRAFT_774779 [Macrolepiota fuliginosa MF-IS2]